MNGPSSLQWVSLRIAIWFRFLHSQAAHQLALRLRTAINHSVVQRLTVQQRVLRWTSMVYPSQHRLHTAPSGTMCWYNPRDDPRSASVSLS